MKYRERKRRSGEDPSKDEVSGPLPWRVGQPDAVGEL